jgi:hypothetical protein
MLAAEPIRNFFELEILSATQWFLALLAAAIGLTIAALVWRLPVIERWEAEIDEPEEPPSPMEESERPTSPPA